MMAPLKLTVKLLALPALITLWLAGCVPSASAVTGTRLDPRCLRQDAGMLYFICSSVPCQLTWPYSQMFGFQQLGV